MKTKLSLKMFFTLAFFNVSVVGFSQSAKWLWDEGFGGAKSESVAGMSKDGNGNIYITGTYSSASFYFGGYEVLDTLLRSFFVAKINPEGVVQWAKTDGGYGGDTIYISPGPTAIVNDAAGNTYITGGFQTDTLVIGNYTMTKSPAGSNTSNIFVAEYDTAGNVVWAEALGGSSVALPNAMALDASGNVYITGDFSSDSITFGGTTLYNNGYGNSLTVKLSSTGQVIWARSASGPAGIDLFDGTDVTSVAMTTSPEHGIYITGFIQSDSVSFGNYTLVNPLGGALVFVTKYDTAGNVLWSVAAGNDSSVQYAYGITADAAANIYVTGSYHGRTTQFGNTVLANAGYGDGNDIFLVKYNPAGEVQWATRAGGNALDEAYGVAAGNNGDLYLTGFFWSRPFIIGHDTFDVVSSDGSAAFVAKYDTAGNEQWAKFAYSYENITTLSVVPDNEGSAYITGYYLGTYMLFDSAQLINAGNTGLTSDIFVAKAGPAVANGIKELSGEPVLTLYPNPSTGKVFVEGLPVHSMVYLYDLAGRLLFSEQTVSSPVTIDVSGLSPGMYIVQTEGGSGKVVKM